MKKKYNERLFQVENESFTLFIFSINGAAGRESGKFFRLIAKAFAES